MPRRPNTKNIPSRLFEESETPVYVVDSSLKIVYANPALATLLNVERDSIIRLKLHYDANQANEGPENLANRLCPPPSLFDPRDPASRERDSPGPQFKVHLEANTSFDCSALVLEQDSENVVICELHQPEVASTEGRVDAQWLHQRIQKFRASQQQQSSQIPFLGDSPAAKRCFSQARAYALLESNVLLIGHPNSQIVDVAKSIHHSGFSDVHQPNPLLPINCQQVEGNRIKEILLGHIQVVEPVDSIKRIFVLLLNADQLDEVGQRDLFELIQTQPTRIRFISTAGCELLTVEDFSSELAHRLSTLELRIPDLVDRPSDIPVLAQSILESSKEEFKTLTADSIRNLQLYPWKSDHQELKEIVLSASRTAQAGEIGESDFPHDFQMALKALGEPRRKFDPIDLDQVLAEIELEAIQMAIAAANGNKTNAARLLGITRARLHRKIAESEDESNSDAPQ